MKLLSVLFYYDAKTHAVTNTQSGYRLHRQGKVFCDIAALLSTKVLYNRIIKKWKSLNTLINRVSEDYREKLPNA